MKFIENMRKVLNVFAFFKSTLAINIALSAFTFVLGGIDGFVTIFLTFGFIVSISIKEIYDKSNYIFYFNNGLSKLKLWLYSYVMTVVFAVLFASVLILLEQLF